MLFKILIILLIFSQIYADDFRQNVQDLTSDNNSYKSELDEFSKSFEELKNTVQALEGKKTAEQILSNKNRFISSAVIEYELDNITGKNSDNDGCIDAEKLGTPQVYIFISSSVPYNTLKNYSTAVEALNGSGIMVMRGLVGGIEKIKPTLNFITNLSCGKTLDELQNKLQECEVSRVDINPLLFRLFKIKEVPAIVWSELTYPELMEYVNTGREIPENKYGIMYGDVEIEYALEKFSKKLSGNFTELILKLKPGYFGAEK